MVLSLSREIPWRNTPNVLRPRIAIKRKHTVMRQSRPFADRYRLVASMLKFVSLNYKYSFGNLAFNFCDHRIETISVINVGSDLESTTILTLTVIRFGSVISIVASMSNMVNKSLNENAVVLNYTDELECSRALRLDFIPIAYTFLDVQLGEIGIQQQIKNEIATFCARYYSTITVEPICC